MSQDDSVTDLLDLLGDTKSTPTGVLPDTGDYDVEPAKPNRSESLPFDDGDSLEDFMETSGVKQQRDVEKIIKPWMKHHDFIVVETGAEVEAIVDEAIATGRCSLDLETQGLDSRIDYDAEGRPRTKHNVVGYCLSPGDGKKGYYVPIRHRPRDGGEVNNVPMEEANAAITRLCRAAQPVHEEGETDVLGFRKCKVAPKVVLYFWNAKFDQEFLYPLTGIDFWHPESFEDGMLASFVLYTDDSNLSLKHKAPELLQDSEGNPYEMIKLKELFVKGRPIEFDQLDPKDEAKEYACSDAICTTLLCQHPEVIPKIKKRANLAQTYRIEKQVIQVVRVMERNRVKIDREKLRALLADHVVKRGKIQEKIVDLAKSKGFHGFSPGSSKQLSDFLFGDPKGLDITPKPEKHEKSGQYKTDAATIEQMVLDMKEKGGGEVPPVLAWMIEWREHDKVIGTYLEKLVANPDSNDELRFNFKETGAATGRFSAPQGDSDQGFSGVPVHGIPGDSHMRQAFIARPGYTMAKCDYAGQELRIAANVSGEPVWLNEFLKGEGDLHTITARAFFNTDRPTPEQRKMAKIANFALVYGGGPAAIMRATGCDKVEATRRKQAFDKALPTFAAWVKQQHKIVKENLGITNPFGRWIAIPDAAVKPGDILNGRLIAEEDAKKIRAACERHSTNYPIQSSGADIMKIALIVLHKEFHKRGWLKNGGDDSVRMLLTVHDEIVFELKHERVSDAIPVIVEGMALPGRMPRPPFSPIWLVPLVVEPLIGDTWGGKYNWEMIKIGKKGPIQDLKLKDYELPYHVQHGDRVYHKIPSWLEGIVKGGWEETAEPASDKPILQTRSASAPPPPPAGDTPPSRPEIPPPAVVTPSIVPPPRPVLASAPMPTGSLQDKIVHFSIGHLSNDTARTIYYLCAKYQEDDGALLLLTNSSGKDTLVDPSLKVRIDPEKFANGLREHTLSDGSFSFAAYQKA